MLLGGDLLPNAGRSYQGMAGGDFVREFLQTGFAGLKEQLGSEYPRVFLILGNDDPQKSRSQAPVCPATEAGGWHERVS